MLKKITAFSLTVMMVCSLMVTTLNVSAAESEVYFTTAGYGWMWGDWATWQIWGLNFDTGTINNGVCSPSIKTNPENGIGGKYRVTDMLIGMFSSAQQVNKLVIKGTLPKTVKVKFRDASKPNPTEVALATDSWAVSRDCLPDNGLTVDVQTDGKVMTIIFSETVNANAIVVEATEPADQVNGGPSPWTVSEFRAYNGAAYNTPDTSSESVTSSEPISDGNTIIEDDEVVSEDTDNDNDEDTKKSDKKDNGGKKEKMSTGVLVSIAVLGTLVVIAGVGCGVYFLVIKKRIIPSEAEANDQTEDK